MALDVQLEILVEGHTHRGVSAPKGSIIQTNPNRAARMVNLGWGKKVGVAAAEREPIAPEEPEEEVSVDEVFEDDDSGEESESDDAEEEDI